MTAISESKAALRSAMRARRDSLPSGLRATHAAAATAHAVALLETDPPRCLAAYVAMRSEIDPADAVAWAARRGIPTAVPSIDGGEMTFRLHTPGDALVEGLFGTRQPAPGAAVADPDVWLVPLLAFDGRCGRLGYGAGHYDRAIARAATGDRRPRLIGFAFSLQHVDRVPLEPHDQRLDAVVTEQGVLGHGFDD